MSIRLALFLPLLGRKGARREVNFGLVYEGTSEGQVSMEALEEGGKMMRAGYTLKSPSRSSSRRPQLVAWPLLLTIFTRVLHIQEVAYTYR
jgi:hypothetical protein